MPLFEISKEDKISSIPALDPDKSFQEVDLEDLIWNFTDDLVGEGLLPIRRQAPVGGGLIPDIICIDRDSNVVVFELKKKIDRKQLAQAIEYGGWAKETSLEQLASIYHDGEDQFWKALNDFTETDSPKPLSGSPRIVLVSPQYAPKTKAGIRMLLESGVPITMITVSLYQGDDDDRLVDIRIEGTRGKEPDKDSGTGSDPQVALGLSDETKKVKVTDLLSVGLLTAGDELEWHRPKSGQTYTATVLSDGEIELPDGFRASSPSGAATRAANIAAYDGWHAWTRKPTSETLHRLRERYVSGDFDEDVELE